MESDWDRSEFIQLTRDEVVDLVSPVAATESVIAVELLASGRANTNYRVRTAQGDLVLRLYTRDAHACAREVAVLAHVRGKAPVPAVLYASTEARGRVPPYIIESWLEGEHPDAVLAARPALASAVGESLGEVAAAIARMRFEHSGFLEMTPVLRTGAPLPGLEAYIASCFGEQGGTERADTDFGARVIAFVAANARYIPDDAGGVSLVHGDFKPSNLLVSPEDGLVTGVLDWEFAFAGSPLFDLATLLRNAASLPPDFERGVIEGYRSAGGRLPEHWRRSVKLLDLANLCAFLTDGDGEGASAGASNRIRDVRGAIERTMEGWEGLD